MSVRTVSAAALGFCAQSPILLYLLPLPIPSHLRLTNHLFGPTSWLLSRAACFCSIASWTKQKRKAARNGGSRSGAALIDSRPRCGGGPIAIARAPRALAAPEHAVAPTAIARSRLRGQHRSPMPPRAATIRSRRWAGPRMCTDAHVHAHARGGTKIQTRAPRLRRAVRAPPPPCLGGSARGPGASLVGRSSKRQRCRKRSRGSSLPSLRPERTARSGHCCHWTDSVTADAGGCDSRKPATLSVVLASRTTPPAWPA